MFNSNLIRFPIIYKTRMFGFELKIFSMKEHVPRIVTGYFNMQIYALFVKLWHHDSDLREDDCDL